MADVFAGAVPVPWEETPSPSRGEDLSSINTLLREIREQAIRPLSCDLAADPLACAILRAWARQPWQEAHRAALVDHLEETGRTARETEWARARTDEFFRAQAHFYRCVPRRMAGRHLKNWRADLIGQFGDFERDTTL